MRVYLVHATLDAVTARTAAAAAPARLHSVTARTVAAAAKPASATEIPDAAAPVEASTGGGESDPVYTARYSFEDGQIASWHACSLGCPPTTNRAQISTRGPASGSKSLSVDVRVASTCSRLVGVDIPDQNFAGRTISASFDFPDGAPSGSSLQIVLGSAKGCGPMLIAALGGRLPFTTPVPAGEPDAVSPKVAFEVIVLNAWKTAYSLDEVSF